MIFVERNLAPIYAPNPDWPASGPQWWRNSDFNEALLAAGARPYFTVGDGTLNNARLWSNDDGTLSAASQTQGGGPFDWSRAGNYSNPPQQAQVHACARLAAPSGTPIMLDVEACSALNFSAIDPPEKWQSAIELAVKILGWMRAVNPRSPLLWYGWPILSVADGPMTAAVAALDTQYMQPLRAALSGAAPSLYVPMWYADWIDRPDKWFDFVDALARDGDRYFEGMPRYAVVSPMYWSFGADHSRDGQPVPLALWREQLEYLHERRFDVLVFTNGRTLRQIGQDHLDALKGFIRQ